MTSHALREALPAGQPLSDAAIVRALRAGDDDALELLYRRYERAVYRTAFGMVHDPMAAEEIVCDTFLRAHRARHQLDPDRPPLAWLQRVALNLAISRLRARRLRVESIEVLGPDAATRLAGASEGEADRTETAALVDRGLARLPDRQRVVVVLRYLLGRSLAEIAALLDEPESTVRHRLHAALRRLRDDLLADAAADGVTEAEPEGGPARVFGATVRHPARRSEASRA